MNAWCFPGLPPGPAGGSRCCSPSPSMFTSPSPWPGKVVRAQGDISGSSVPARGGNRQRQAKSHRAAPCRPLSQPVQVGDSRCFWLPCRAGTCFSAPLPSGSCQQRVPGLPVPLALMRHPALSPETSPIFTGWTFEGIFFHQKSSLLAPLPPPQPLFSPTQHIPLPNTRLRCSGIRMHLGAGCSRHRPG